MHSHCYKINFSYCNNLGILTFAIVKKIEMEAIHY